MRIDATPLTIGLAFIALASIAFALATGSESADFSDLLGLLNSETDPITRTIIVDLRAPRALSAFAVGGLLAIAGVLMQVLLRNPLADPYILGASGGAAVAALAAILLGLAAAAVGIAAFAGALAATFLVFGAARFRGNWSAVHLLLTGVVLAAGFSACISVMLALSPREATKGMLFWLMGDFAYSDWPWILLAVLAAAAIACTVFARELNVMARGETQSRILGLDYERMRIVLFVAASALTAAAVTAAGPVGFVGLVIPHLIRLMTGSDHRKVIPAAVLAGGSLLVIADTLARSLIAPRQLPVGALTALLGVPLFLYLLRRQGRNGG